MSKNFIAIFALMLFVNMPLCRANTDIPTGARMHPPAVQEQPSSTETQSPMDEYSLGAGDRLRITVYGEDDLSGEYDVGSTGLVSLPLIGAIEASKHSLHDLEEAIRVKLADGYLHDPRVSVEVVNYRPFFILGEVSKPGSYPYVNGMTVLNAIALAGGYTYRADEDGVTIRHPKQPEKEEQRAHADATVMPGDIIRVPERFF